MKKHSATVLMDLMKSEEELWEAVHSKHRSCIRKARKLGVEVQAGGNPDACYRLYRSHCRGKLLQPAGRESLFENRQLHTASQGGEVIAFCTVGLGQTAGTAVIRLGATRRERRATEGNTLLLWHIITYYKRCGYQALDLGGVDLHSDETKGIDRYKLRWGGELVQSEIDATMWEYLWWKYLRKSKLARRVWYWKGALLIQFRSIGSQQSPVSTAVWARPNEARAESTLHRRSTS